MDQNFWTKIKNYSEKAVNVVKKHVDVSKIKFDHINYQTTSSDYYEKIIKDLSEEIEVIKEIPHSGRRLTIAKIKKPFMLNGFEIDRIEISEPKPSRKISIAEPNHCAFYFLENYSNEIQILKSKGIKIDEEMIIGNDRFIKISENGIYIELRNNRLGDASDIQTNGNGIDLDDLQKQLVEEKDAKLRALADYQNLQKRIIQQKEEYSNSIKQTMLAELIDLDNDIERFIKNANLNENDKNGILNIKNKIQSIFSQQEIIEIPCKIGDQFDHLIHEALSIIKTDKKKDENKINEIYQKGYKFINGQIIKPVKVIVSKYEEK